MKHQKFTALLLALLTTLPIFTSCAGDTSEEIVSQSNPSVTAEGEAMAEPAETELSDDLPETNLNGYEFRFYSMLWTDGVEAAHRIMAEDFTGDPVNDALRESTLNVEDRFNCSIKLVEGGDVNTMPGSVTNMIQAGDNAFDVTVGHDGSMNNLMNQGLFYNIKSIDQFNFDKPWWGPSSLLDISGKMYLASSYLSYTGLHWTRALMIHKGLMTNLGVEIPYDTVREGTWTLDKMIALTENTYEDTDGNGKKTDADRIGLCTGVETLYCLQESLDLSAYSKQDDGTIALNFDIERMDSALSKLRTLYGTQDFTYKTNSAFTSEIFKTGTAMMVLGQIADAYDIYRECDFNYGFLPCPKYDELQKNYVSGCTDLPWAIPKTITEEQTDIIGTVVEAISCYNYKNVLPVYFESAMKSRIADSPDDADMLQIIADGRTLSLAFQYGLTYNDTLRKLINTDEGVASYYQSNEKVAQKTLERLVQSFAEWQ